MYDRELYTSYHDWINIRDMQYVVDLDSGQSLLNAVNYVCCAGPKLLGPNTFSSVFECKFKLRPFRWPVQRKQRGGYEELRLR